MLKIVKVSVRERRLSKSYREYAAPTRVYVWPAKETVAENLCARWSRPYEAWRPVVIKELQDAGIKVMSIKWRQNAGCACGCSPGFLVTTESGGPVRLDDKPIDIHITIKGA